MTVPRELAFLLRGSAVAGMREQAFPFVTVDERGYPHATLLSRAEVDVTADGRAVVAALASGRTGENLLRSGRAGLVAVGEMAAHYAKLSLTRTVEWEGMLGAELAVEEHEADSLGIALQPLLYDATEEFGRMERWEVSVRLLASLGADLPPPR